MQTSFQNVTLACATRVTKQKGIITFVLSFFSANKITLILVWKHCDGILIEVTLKDMMYSSKWFEPGSISSSYSITYFGIHWEVTCVSSS